MPGIADKFTQSAQGRLLWPGMTSFVEMSDSIVCILSCTGAITSTQLAFQIPRF
jgi:hypothetical protein